MSNELSIFESKSNRQYYNEVFEACCFSVVDIWTNSSQITKLRLWIELLKNSYYNESFQLVTLPNIDINIKTGNSLISRFELQDELKIKNIKEEIKNYKQRVSDYKNNLGTKKEVLESIANLKEKFKLSLKAEAKIQKDFDEKLKNYYLEFGFDGLDNTLILKCLDWRMQQFQATLFGEKDTKKQTKILEELTSLQAKIDEIEKGKIYDDAFEWRFEFPEVLDEDGNFVGFDIVIGNPPYIPLENFASVDKLFFQNKFKNFSRKYESSVMFIEEGLSVLRSEGILAYIAPQTWQTGENYSLFRKNILDNFGIYSVVNLPFNIFDDAYIDTSIYLMGKKRLNGYKIYSYDKKEKISNIDQIDFLNISVDAIDKKNYKLIINKDISTKSEDSSANDMLFLGDITISTQGLSGSKFTEDADGDIYPYLSKGNVFNYTLTIENTHTTDLSKFKNLKKYYEKEEKILIRRIINRQNRLSVGYTNEKLVFKKDINPFIVIDIEFSTKYILALLASRYISWFYVNSSIIATKNDFRQTTLTELRMLPIRKISNLTQYKNNINILLNLQSKKYYDNETPIVIGKYKEQEIKITEFLFAKNRGYILDLKGHSEISEEYFTLLPYLFCFDLFDEYLENINDDRNIFVLFDGAGHRIMHVIDANSKLVSVFVVSEKNFKKQLGRRFRYQTNLQGRANLSSILSPASPFWRQASSIEEVYLHLSKNTLTQENFIVLVDEILEAKKQNPKADTSELENQIDQMVYKLYCLSDEEIAIIEGV